MPWYEVVVTATQVIAVEAEDSSTAQDLAFEEAFNGVDCSEKTAEPAIEQGGTEAALFRHCDMILRA